MTQSFSEWFQEGEEISEIEFTGLEAVRSDVADITQIAQKEMLETLLKDDFGTAWKNISSDLRDYRDEIMNGEMDLDMIAKRGGIRKPLDEYGSTSRTPQPIYRGAKYADEHFDGVDIKAGSKPLTYYVSKISPEYPQTYTADTAESGNPVDAVAVEDPRDLPEGITIDFEKHCRKVLEDPLRPILHTIGKSMDDVIYDHEQVGFTEFA